MRQIIRLQLSVLIILLLFVVGCRMESPTADTKPIELSEVIQISGSSINQYVFNEPAGNDAVDADFASFQFAAAQLYHFHPSSGLSMADAVEAAETSLSAKDGRDRAMAEQALAFMLLDHHLADGRLASTPASELAKVKLDEEDQVVVGFALDLLVRNDNLNADLIAAGLNTMKGAWSSDKIRATAASAEVAATNALAIPVDCTDCGLTGATRDRFDDIRAGIENLRLVSTM